MDATSLILNRISATLGASIYLLAIGLYEDRIDNSPNDLTKFGPTVDSGSLASILTVPTILQIVLIVNTPQILVSLAYFQLNAIASIMLANAEWASFAFKRNPLRVSSPKGDQRSTYWLQLPHSYAIPLLAIFAILHWAISQSIYLTRIAVYQDDVLLPIYDLPGSTITLGWTSGALLLSIILGGLLFLIVLGFAIFKRYPAGLPLLGSCSLVIAAACHRRADDKEVELGPVQWGVIDMNEGGSSHCGFASERVRMPVEGEVCA